MAVSPSGPSGFGRVPRCVSAPPVLRAHEAPSASPGPVPADGDYASRLPVELLDLIFDSLPLSCHGAAAQACRRWYSHMPDTRLQLARWLAQRTSCLSELGWHIMAGYSHRTGPWLARQGYSLLPLLHCQYQHCLQQGLAPERARGRAAPRPVRWLAGLVLYSLYQCRIKAAELPLRTVALPDSPVLIRGIALSMDGLRMALVCHTEPLAPPELRVYSWTSCSWQQDTLMDAPSSVVTQVCFAVGQLDELLTCHRNGQLLSWRRLAETASWYPQEVYKIAGHHRVNRLITLVRGDMVLDTGTENHGEKRLVFCRYDEDSLTRDCATSRRYTDAPYSMAEAIDRLALTVINRQQDGARMELHIWKRGLDPTAPREWGCQISPLDTPRPLVSLAWSRDRQQLLGRVPSRAGSRLWILRFDHHCRLRSQAFFPAPLAPELVNLKACVLLDMHRSQRLVVPESLYRMQFWRRDEDDCWQPGARLVRFPPTGVAADQHLRYVLLPGDGRTLVEATEKEVAIWQDTGTAVWRRVLKHRVESPGLPAPNCGRLADSELLWVTIPGRDSTLWLYGPDAEGRMVRKTAIDTGGPVRIACSSFDGLSLMFLGQHGQALCLQASSTQ